MVRLVLLLAAALMAIATLHYALHHREREYRQPYREPEDGVQPWDVPPYILPLPDIGTGYPVMPETWPRPDWQGYRVTSTTSSVNDTCAFDPRCAATGLAPWMD